MAQSRFHRTFGYSLAVITAATAVVIITGFLLPDGVPSQFRIMFGVVLFLLAGYRAVITYFQSRQTDRGSHE
ncbi:MAG: hypothetical protein HY962_03515 [Ignavibacteriae bacterium]|nr:hypothetical protein [Ignavibacteriota bacterium]